MLHKKRGRDMAMIRHIRHYISTLWRLRHTSNTPPSSSSLHYRDAFGFFRDIILYFLHFIFHHLFSLIFHISLYFLSFYFHFIFHMIIINIESFHILISFFHCCPPRLRPRCRHFCYAATYDYKKNNTYDMIYFRWYCFLHILSLHYFFINN